METTRSKIKVQDMVYIAIGAVLITVCSWISIPTTVPFTLQTFAVFLVLSLIGGKRGTLSVIIYLLLGAVGVPVFAGFKAGFATLLGTTGGYIIGFIFMGLIYWLSERLFGNRLAVRIATLVVGLVVCYAFGTAWFMIVYIGQSGAVGLGTALGWCVIPFIIPDLVKLAVAVLIGTRLRKLLHI